MLVAVGDSVVFVVLRDVDLGMVAKTEKNPVIDDGIFSFSLISDLYFLAASNSSSILIADSLMGVPGPKMATAPAS